MAPAIKDSAERPGVAPTIKRSSNRSFSDGISINPITKSKVEQTTEEIDISSKPSEAFTQEQFETTIKAFKKILQTKGKDSLASIFETVPDLKEDTILLLIENKALADDFNSQRADFLTFIREKLNNYTIQVETNVNKDTTRKKAYTPQEKFLKMSEKNPNLNQLVKALDMDVGYA